jgi:hypothetical protein
MRFSLIRLSDNLLLGVFETLIVSAFGNLPHQVRRCNFVSWPSSIVCAGVLVIYLEVGLALRQAPSLTSSLNSVDVETLPSPRVLLSRRSSVLWSPATSHPASSWISPLRLIPFVTLAVDQRPDQTSPVPSPAFTTSRSPYAGGFFTAAVQALHRFGCLRHAC